MLIFISNNNKNNSNNNNGNNNNICLLIITNIFLLHLYNKYLMLLKYYRYENITTGYNERRGNI